MTFSEALGIMSGPPEEFHIGLLRRLLANVNTSATGGAGRAVKVITFAVAVKTSGP